MKEAQELMERAQKMDKLIANKKQSIEEKRDKLKKKNGFCMSKSC